MATYSPGDPEPTGPVTDGDHVTYERVSEDRWRQEGSTTGVEMSWSWITGSRPPIHD